MEHEIEHEPQSPSGSSDNEGDYDGGDHDEDDHDEDDHDGYSIAIIQINGGDEFEADIVMLFNDEQISVTVFAPYQSSGSSVAKRIVDLIRQPCVDNHNGLSPRVDDYNSFCNTILNVIQPAGEEEFLRVAPKAPAPSPRRSNTKLHSLLYPKTHYFAFRREAPDAQPKIVRMSPSEVQARAWAPSCDGGVNEDYADGKSEEIRSLLSRLRIFRGTRQTTLMLSRRSLAVAP